MSSATGSPSPSRRSKPKAILVVAHAGEDHDSPKPFSLSDSGTLKAGELKINRQGVEFGEGGRELLLGIKHDQSPLSRTDPMANFEILKLIGNGSSGLVRKVNYIPENVILALKTIPLDLKDEKVRRQILFELQSLHDFEHPNIVSFHGAFLNEGAIHIALEFMDASLADVKRRLGSLGEDVLAAIVKQVLAGLAYLHEHRIIHRDIKPGNILINYLGEVKVADFGVSQELANSMAKCNSWVGTTTYMSPERIKGETYGMSADIWSLGLLMMELRTGDFPFDMSKAGFFELLDLVVERPSPTFAPGQASPALADFVAKCLEKNPAARPAAEDLLKHPFLAKGAKVDLRDWFINNMVDEAERDVYINFSKEFVESESRRAGSAGLRDKEKAASKRPPPPALPSAHSTPKPKAYVNQDELAKQFAEFNINVVPATTTKKP